VQKLEEFKELLNKDLPVDVDVNMNDDGEYEFSKEDNGNTFQCRLSTEFADSSDITNELVKVIRQELLAEHNLSENQ